MNSHNAVDVGMVENQADIALALEKFSRRNF